MTDDILADATEKIARKQAERLDREIHAAWRAGYNYLHVYMPMVTPHNDDPADHFTVRMGVIPSYEKKPPVSDTAAYSRSYDLTELTREKVQEVL